jgi:protein translocase SecG subunit
MKSVFLVVHFLITLLLIAGVMIQTSKSEGLGSIGGGSDTLFRGSSAKGFEGMVEKWLVYLAYGFLATSFLTALVIR